MAVANRSLGMFLIAIALAVLVNWIATPLYHDGGSDYPVWDVLNWFMAVAIALALAVNLGRKIRLRRDDPDGPLTRKSLETNLSLYASLVLTSWFFWNWFYGFFPENESALVGEIHLGAWVLINPLFFLICGTTGLHLLRAAADD